MNSFVKEYQLGEHRNENSAPYVEGISDNLGDYKIIPTKMQRNLYFVKYKEDGKRTYGIDIVHNPKYNLSFRH